MFACALHFSLGLSEAVSIPLRCHIINNKSYMIRNAFSSFARCTRMHIAHAHTTQADSTQHNTTKIHTTDSELNSILSILQATTKCCGFKFTKFIQFTFQLCVSLVTKQCSKTWRQKPCRRSFLTIILHAIEHHPKNKNKNDNNNQSTILKDVGVCVRLWIECFPN